MSKISETVRSAGSFLRDCRVEMGKISWPSRRELMESTKVVAAFILLVAVFVFVTDFVLGKVMTYIMK